MNAELESLAQSYVQAVEAARGAAHSEASSARGAAHSEASSARGAALRSVVSEAVHYRDPLTRSEGVDGLLAELEAQSRVFPGLRAERVFADGGDICVVFGTGRSGVVVDVLEVRDGRIDRISRVFDARPVQKIRAEI